jgi:hypothetical protein
MAKDLVVLDRIVHGNPCAESWEAMPGDAWVRRCAKCDQSVYNLSSLTRKEAERLLRNRGAEICTAFYRRPDGTLLTQRCPSSVRRAWGQIAAGLAAIGLALPTQGRAAYCPVSRVEIKSKPRETQKTFAEVVVMDASGAVIPEVPVELERDQMVIRRQTDAKGRVADVGLDPGIYTLTAQSDGFKTLTQKEIEIQAGRSYVFQVTLELGSVGGNAMYAPAPVDLPGARPSDPVWRSIAKIWS